jgi:ATP-binding cassette subfamily F protein 3
MQEIQAVAPDLRPAEVRDYLAKFLFTGDDVFKEVSVLSGGERGRLALACLALQGANLLLLDEPTNHLDLPAQEVLQAILADYKGTILLVSHDRYLIDALATQIWEVIPSESALRVFSGTYSEYKEFKAAQAAAAAQTGGRPKAEVSHPRQASGPSKMELRKRQQRLEAVEGEIAGMETQLAAITHQLEDPGNDSLRIQRLGQEYSRLQQDLEKKMDEWTALSEEQA